MASAGIPFGVLGDLKLTADQKAKIASIINDSAQTRRQKLQEALA